MTSKRTPPQRQPPVSGRPGTPGSLTTALAPARSRAVPVTALSRCLTLLRHCSDTSMALLRSRVCHCFGEVTGTDWLRRRACCLIEIVEVVLVHRVVEQVHEARVRDDDVVRQLVEDAGVQLVGDRPRRGRGRTSAGSPSIFATSSADGGAASLCCGNSSSSPGSNQMNSSSRQTPRVSSGEPAPPTATVTDTSAASRTGSDAGPARQSRTLARSCGLRRLRAARARR